MSNRVIQSLWVHGRLSPMERLCIRSFLAHGHEFHLYAYGPLEGVPGGTRVVDAREILPEDRVFQQRRSGFGKGSYRTFSDLFRYQLLWERGGWWVDTDMVCLKPFEFSRSRVIATCWEPGGVSRIVNSVLKLPAKDPVARYCLDACRRAKLETIQYGEVGPMLVASAVHELGLTHTAVPWPTFCPIGYRDAAEVTRRPGAPCIRGVKRLLRRHPPVRIGSDSYAVHLWNEMWRQNGLDKALTYHPRSYYEQSKARYLGAAAEAPD